MKKILLTNLPWKNKYKVSNEKKYKKIAIKKIDIIKNLAMKKYEIATKILL